MSYRIVFLLSMVVGVTGCDAWNKLTEQIKGQASSGSATTAPPPPVPEHQIAAKVNNTYITVDEVQRRIDALEEAARPNTFEERKELLEQLVREELLVQDAAARGVERAPDVKNRLNDFRRFVLLDALSKQIVEQVSVESKEVEEYYKQYQAGFREPERIRVRQIVLRNLEEAEVVRTRVVQGDNFSQVAQERSVGAGKEQGGDIGWHLRAIDKEFKAAVGQPTEDKTFFPQLESVAFAVDVGQVSQPVKGPDGNYYLVKVEERQPAKQKSLTEVWDQIHDGLLLQKRQEAVEALVKKLRQQADVVVHADRLGAS